MSNFKEVVPFFKALGKIKNVQTYLEIGVERGETFTRLGFPYKTGVDPLFAFNNWAHPGTWHEITSDRFFEGEVGIEDSFDFIFIDGLHHFDQVYRDFTNALEHSHDDSIIIIDDVYPCDEFSTMRDQEECCEARGDGTRAWNGDVYKAIILLRLFHPKINYATVMDLKVPQTVIWFGGQNPFKSQTYKDELTEVVQNLENADYAWLKEHEWIYNKTDTKALLEHL